MDEFALIAKYFAPLSGKGSLALKDDAAVFTAPAGHELVITKDAIVEGVHFVGDEPADLVARKLLRVNLSDMAAMGAKPYGYLLALMLPSADEKWLDAFARGLRADQKEFGVTLLGGDTTRTPGPLCLSATMLGFVPKGKALLRSGARAGDDVWVSGTIGDAALGLQFAVRSSQLAVDGKSADRRLPTANSLLSRYRLPSPRVTFGQKLRGIATACIDVSDGLVQDLGHICECSGVGAVVRWQDVPLSKAIRSLMHPPHPLRLSPQLPSPRWGDGQGEGAFYEIILTGGDDYELCFTAPPALAQKVLTAGKASKTPVTRIGKVVKGHGVRILDEEGKEIRLSKKGYSHF